MKHTLSNGIEIEDLRHVQCGVRVTNQFYKHADLVWSSIVGFYISVSGMNCLSVADIEQRINDLTELKQALKEANELIK